MRDIGDIYARCVSASAPSRLPLGGLIFSLRHEALLGGAPKVSAR